MNKYNWDGIHVQSQKDDWKNFEKNNATIILNILFAKKEKIHPTYFSKHYLNREKQVILLMILNRKG